MFRNLLTPIFRLTKSPPLPFIPLDAINVPLEAPPVPRACPAPRPTPPWRSRPEVNDVRQHTNQLSS